MKLILITIIFFTIITGIVLPDILRIKIETTEARKFLQDCKDLGGQPVYDICFKAPLIPIEVNGEKYAPEVYEYNN